MRCEICGDWMASAPGKSCFRCAGAADLGGQWLPPMLPVVEPAAEIAAAAAAPTLGQELALDRRSRPRDPTPFAEAQEAAPNTEPRELPTIPSAEPPHEDWSAAWEERWDVGLADAYREALATEEPSGVLQACVDRLEDVSSQGSGGAGFGAAWGGDGAFGEEERFRVEGGAGALEEDSFDVDADRWGMVRMQLAAGAVDAALLSPLVAGVSWIAGPGSASMAFCGIAAFCYLTLSGFLGGRTLGDRLVGLQTIDSRSGQGPSLARAALRAVVGVLGTAALLVGPLWSLFDAEARTLHDRLAGTATLPVA